METVPGNGDDIARRNEAIRSALAAGQEIPIEGELVVTRSIEVTEAAGNARRVDFVKRVPQVPPEILGLEG